MKPITERLKTRQEQREREKLKEEVKQDIINNYYKRQQFWYRWNTYWFCTKYWLKDIRKRLYKGKVLSRQLRIAQKMEKENYIKNTKEVLTDFYYNILEELAYK